MTTKRKIHFIGIINLFQVFIRFFKNLKKTNKL